MKSLFLSLVFVFCFGCIGWAQSAYETNLDAGDHSYKGGGVGRNSGLTRAEASHVRRQDFNRCSDACARTSYSQLGYFRCMEYCR